MSFLYIVLRVPFVVSPVISKLSCKGKSMYEIMVEAISLIDHFDTVLYKPIYNPNSSGKIAIIPAISSQMVDFYQYLVHFGLKSNISGYFVSYDRYLLKENSDEYIFEPFEFNYIDDDSEIFTFEFPDEETALYFNLKFNPEIVHEEN